MKKLYLLLGCMTLAACNAGCGSTGPQGAPGKSAYEIWLEQGNSGSEQDFLDSLGSNHKDPSPDDIDENLKDSEKLFGNGIGTGATPTHLISRLDNVGTEVLSFAAWGNVYDLRKASDTINIKGAYSQYDPAIFLRVWDPEANEGVYDFTTQQNMEIENWRKYADASVSNAVFTGPALMYKGSYGTGGTFHADGESDYGTMKVQFGYDIGTPARIEFVMSNSDNNLITNGAWVERFSDDMNNIYIMKIIRDDDKAWNDKAYRGYGHRN